jgi:hypothetical protein
LASKKQFQRASVAFALDAESRLSARACRSGDHDGARLVTSLGTGTIAERADNPTGKPRWQWSCGFYPGSHPSESAKGIAETFDQARGAFEIA